MRASSPCSASVRPRAATVSSAAASLRLISRWMSSGLSIRASTSCHTASSSSSARTAVVVAHRTLWTAPALGAVTSIVMAARSPAASRPGVPSHGVPTMRADTKPLEKRQLGALACREALIGRPLLLCARKECLVDDRGNGQLDPFLPRAGPCARSGAARRHPSVGRCDCAGRVCPNSCERTRLV